MKLRSRNVFIVYWIKNIIMDSTLLQFFYAFHFKNFFIGYFSTIQ